MTHLGSIAFTYYMQFFPNTQALVFEHLHKTVETPIIVDHPIANLPFPLLFRGLLFLLVHDHLPLGKITDDHSSFSQSVRDKRGGFVQTVVLFAAFAFGDALVHVREINVTSRLLLTSISLRADFVQLFVVPAIALEPANVVEAALITVAGG
jgi:hypothetical protein